MFPPEPVPETLGAYKVLRRLSGSGSTTVYLGRLDGPMGFHRTCELKLVPNTAEGDTRFAEELAREAWICAQLNHPSIVRMYDFFEHKDQLVLVLEHVEGVHLDRLLRHLVSRRQKLGDASVYYITSRIAGALAHAHGATDQQGRPAPVIHRNLHPGNVIIGWDGQVRLTGFGLGKILGRTPDTVVGMIKGTPGYMAPEQSRGERATVKADVYGVGLLLWALLSGRRPPLDGTRPAPIMTLRPDLPQPVGALLEAALAPRPEDRKTDCAAFEKMLARVVRFDVGKGELVRCIQSVHATIEFEDAGGQPDRRPTLPVKAKGALLFRAPAGAKVPAEALGGEEGEAQPAEKDGEEPAEEVDIEPDEAGAEGPAAGGSAGAPIQFGPPPATPLGGGVHFGPPPFIPAGVTPLPGGVTPLPGGITPIPGAVPIQFGPPPAIPPAQAPPEGEITQSRSFAQAQRSFVGTIAVSASTATLVAVIWISIAYYRSSPTPDRDATLPPASAPPPVTAPLPPPKPTAVPAPASAAPTAKASAPPEDLDGSSLPAGIGFLTVRFPEPANVYLSGKLMGAANGPLQVRCGQWWVRVARPVQAKYPDWLSKGMTVNVACQGSTSVNLQPSAGKPR